MKYCNFVFAFVLFLFYSCKSVTESNSSDKPNVIVILTDDQGYGDMSIHGNPYLKTPNIDDLRNESIRLTDFHVQPMCAPTRGELLTGVHCMVNGCFSTSMGKATVKKEIPMISEVFKENGYTTGLFGKWHLGYNWPHRPMDRGFDEVVYFQGFGLTGVGHHWNSDYYDPYYYHMDTLKQAKGWYCNDFWFDQAMNWMKKCNDEKQPFFCYLPTNLPHGPKWVDTVYSDQYKGSGAEDFYGMISNLDENMGKMLAFLNNENLAENTILIYTTDNGSIEPDVYNAGMTGGKCTRWEGGHRVPCFIRWPNGELSEPTDINTPTQVKDLFPTLIDLCNLQSAEAMKFDGVSLAGLLRGEPLDDRMFVIQYQQNDLKKYDAAIVWKNWRLIPIWGDQLFDIHTDLAQRKSVGEKNPEVVKKMRAFYDEWWENVEPGLSWFEPVHIGSDQQPEVMLCSSDWEDVRADGQSNVRQAGFRVKDGAEFEGGTWSIYVEQQGKYIIDLYRYPKEADAFINEILPEFVPKFGEPEPEGVSINAKKLVLFSGNEQHSSEITANDKFIRFELNLKKGNSKITSWFEDENSNKITAPYYAYIRMKTD